jgi:signal transduction histidine kinase
MTTSNSFLAGGGEMGAFIREHNWSATSLGPYDNWSQSLRTVVRLLLNTHHPMYIFWGSEGLCLYNDGYRQSIGPERHPGSLGLPARTVWDEIWPIIGPQIEQVMRGRGATWHENQLVPITRGGNREDVYWTYSYSPIDDESAPGGIGGVLVVCTETTAQVLSERRMAAESRRQQLLLKQMPGYVGVLSGPNHVFDYVNDAYVAISGPRNFIGRSVRDVFPELQGQGFYELLDGVYASGEPFVARAMPIQLAGEDAQRFIDVLYEPIRGDDGVITGIFVGGYDVTEQVRAQTALKRANATLEERVASTVRERENMQAALVQSQKMEAVGQLTGGLAHDFNNLLMGITGSLQLLESRVAQGRADEIDRYIGAAQGAAKRASALTHRLLAFSRQQTLEPKVTDINRLVAGMEDLIRRTIGPAVALETVANVDLWATLVDQSQLENALLNLCINARDAMTSGGKLTIETCNHWLDKHGTIEQDFVPGQYVILSVTDSGVGMTAEVIARAFDPFFTTKPRGQGTGLGLSMIYGFAKQSGGHARIYSEPGNGTRVCIYLPRHLGSLIETDEVREGTKLSHRGSREAILVVDDEPVIRMLVAEVLDELGYSALQAADGPTALKILQSNTPIGLLITDVGLPGGMNGRQVADAARAVQPGVKVLFITGYAENTLLTHGQFEPGTQVLTKPFLMEVLAERVQDLMVREGPAPGDESN